MKKLKFLNVLFLFVTLGFLASCGSNDSETPAPTIRISSTNPAAVSGKINTTAGAVVEITLVSEAKEGIERINATQKIGTTESQVSGFPISSGFTTSTSDTRVVTYTVPASASGDITLRFAVIDKKNKEAAVSITVSVAPIKTFTAVLLNNQSSSTQSSFFNATTGTVYTSLAEAKTNSGNVDFIHILRNAANGGRKIVAPNSADATAIYGADLTNPNNITTWTTRRATKFKGLTLTQAAFDAITTESALLDAAGAVDTFTADNIGSLAVGSSFAFVTDGGKRGIAIVTAVSGPNEFTPGGTNAGSITITVKTQN